MQRPLYHEFAVMLFSQEDVKGCLFRRKAGRFEIRAFAAAAVDPQDPPAAWKKVRKEIGCGKECPLILAGSLENAYYYQTTLPDLPAKAMKEALLFELPQFMLGDTAGKQIQFFSTKSSQVNNEADVNFYAFDPAALNKISALVSQSLKKIDFFIYPLLALRKQDPPAFIPEIEKEFFFQDRQWFPVSEWNDEWNDEWKQIMTKLFIMPDDPGFSVNKYLGCLLIGRMVIANEFPAGRKGLQILPARLKPGRLRNQLRIMTTLLILLAAGIIWNYGAKWIRESREISRLANENARLTRQLSSLKKRLKTMEKEQKEHIRVINQKPGEYNIIGKMADLSRILPQNVMVQNLRWSDSSLDMTLRSDAENLSLPNIIRPLNYWKIAQLQQRRRPNETSSTITIKLVPAENTEVE